MTAVWLATCVRLKQVMRERDRALDVVIDGRSRVAVAARMEEFAREYDAMTAEIPPDSETGGQPAAPGAQAFVLAAAHLQERVRSDLRRNARGYLQYWDTDPEPLPQQFPFAAFAAAYLATSVRQLRQIAERVREGHDGPSPEMLRADDQGNSEPPVP